MGVNNRNLHTFEVTLDTSLRLVARMPAGVVKVAESGIIRALMWSGSEARDRCVWSASIR